ncbi:MAG TPA: hypothetical protein VFQ36_16495 [Ktedonobacteraceae bacterium]|nr:hypothetical protein [Ktedonobacteraceae bacterium]
MIETNTQNQQQDKVSLQPSPVESGTSLETGLTVTCAICEAVYAPSALQAPFLQSTRGALEAAFMGICHFCFRCRRAACPQCWDGVHGVCGSCVLEAGLPFRATAAPLAGLVFPPTLHQSLVSHQPQQTSSLFVLVRNGRLYVETQATPDQANTDPTIQHVTVQAAIFDDLAADNGKKEGHAAVTTPLKKPLPAVLNNDRKQEKKPVKAKAAKKASRLALTLTWIVLAIVLVLVVVITLAEYIPAVNALVARVAHIDIHAEIAYLVHIVRQFFKK